jgi:signal peptidase II
MEEEINPLEEVDTKIPAADEVQKASTGERSILFLVMLAVLVLDQLSKAYIEKWLPINGTWSFSEALAPIFRITHVSNTGAAFGIFPSGSALFTIVAILVSIFVIIYSFRLPAHNARYRIALGLMLGGAIGNLIDRFRIGHVTDFIDIGPVPVWNVADASIVCGTILLGILMLLDERKEKQAREAEEAAAQEAAAQVAGAQVAAAQVAVAQESDVSNAEAADDPSML